MTDYYSLFIGAGTLATYFFHEHCHQGWGIVRRTAGPLINICADIQDLDLKDFKPLKTLVIALSPDSHDLQSYQHTYLHLLPLLLSSLTYERVIFISSTRVYAQELHSLWLNEDSNLHESDPWVSCLLSAERAVQFYGFRDFVILRPSGLYESLSPPPSSWLDNTHWANRIHYEDLARLLKLAIERPKPCRLVMNASDDHPFIPQKIVPLFKDLRPSAPMKTRPSRNAKISNLLTHSLGFSYRYPSILDAYKNSGFLKTVL